MAQRCGRDGAGSFEGPCIQGARAQNAKGRSQSRPSKSFWQPGAEGLRGWGPPSAFCFVFRCCGSLRARGPSDGAGTGSRGAVGVSGHCRGRGKFSYLSVWYVNTVVLRACF